MHHPVAVHLPEGTFKARRSLSGQTNLNQLSTRIDASPVWIFCAVDRAGLGARLSCSLAHQVDIARQASLAGELLHYREKALLPRIGLLPFQGEELLPRMPARLVAPSADGRHLLGDILLTLQLQPC